MKDFLFTLLAWLITLPFIIGAIVFAVYNGEAIPVIVNPFKDPLVIPLYVPVLAAVAFGFVFGSVMTWAGMSAQRAKIRTQARTIKALEKQIEQAPPVQATVESMPLLPPTYNSSY